MSIIRFSCVEGKLFAPAPDGRFVSSPYDPATRTGLLGELDAAGVFTDIALGSYLDSMIASEGARLDASQPIVLMVNGFLFDPRVPGDNPHTGIFHFNKPGGTKISTEEVWYHNVGWPAWLDFQPTDAGSQGLVLAFGYFSNPGLLTSIKLLKGNIYAQATKLADQAASALLKVVRESCDRLGDRRIDILAHSLGTWVTLGMMNAALNLDAAFLKMLDRVVLMHGAAYRTAAVPVIAAIEPMRDGPQVINMMNGIDRVLRDLGRVFGPGPTGIKPVIGFDGVPGRHERWLNFRLDDPALKKWGSGSEYAFMAHLGSGQPFTDWANHWAGYCAESNIRFVRNFLRFGWSIEDLRTMGLPESG